MKSPYSIALSQVARALHALGLKVSELMQSHHRDLNGPLGKVAEIVLHENNDRSRRVLSSFVRRYHGQLFSSLVNIENEDDQEFPSHIEKIAAHLILLSKEPEEITNSGWRSVNSIFGNLCQLEQISKRKEVNRKKMYNLWICKNGLLRACYDSLLLKTKIEEEDNKYTMESCSSSESTESDSEDIPKRKTHPVGFKECVIKVGTIKLERSLLELMEDSKESMNLCIKEIIESVCKGCVVNVSKVNHNKGHSPCYTGYAYCSFRSCRLYKIMIYPFKKN